MVGLSGRVKEFRW